jgi:cell division protease FtsH
LGGRAAEEIVYGTRTTGAESDIEQATLLARNMVTRWGMSEKLGMVQFAPHQNPYLPNSGFGATTPYSEATARVIDMEVRAIIDESHEEALRLLTAHRRELDALVVALLAHETLNEQEVLTATGLPPAPALESGRISAALQKNAVAHT